MTAPDQAHAPDDLMEIEQVCRHLNVHRRTVNRWVKDGVLKSAVDDRTPQFHRSDIEALAEGHTDFLTAAAVAELLAASYQSVQRWTRQGLLPSIRIGPRGDHRYPRAEIEALAGGHDDLVPPGVAVRILGIHHNTLSKWAACGRVTRPIRLPGGAYRYSRHALEALAKECAK